MSLNSRAFLSESRGGKKIKHLSHRTGDGKLEDLEFIPRIYFEAKIDFCDVRYGFRDTRSVSKAFEIFPIDGDVLWTNDMVWDIDPANLAGGKPEGGRMRPLPAFVDADFLALVEGQFFSYLMRYFSIRVYRNFVLNAYSAPGESLDEFQIRCTEMLAESLRKDLDALHEVFQRRLEQTREKCLKESDDLMMSGDFEAAKSISLWKSKIHNMSERLADLFLKTELKLDLSRAPEPISERVVIELDERLQSLEMEARQQISQFLDQYQDKLRTIDEYTIHPNLKDIHLVRICILWMPEKVKS